MEGKISRINNTTDLVVVDRISDLPDSILGHIMSFLPTKEAVATSILSKRWKFAWLGIHNLDFYYHDSQKEGWNSAENMEFVGFVDRVLLLTDGGPLNKFSLVWGAWTISSHFISWINTAITRNVRELYLDLGAGDLLTIPISGFNCDSLQSLEVNDLTFLYDATVVFLPRLESLKLDHVFFESKKACEKLISGCPMLRYLKLHICYRDYDTDDDDFTCIISSASLRRLDLCFENKSMLKLKASSLEYLRLRGYISDISVEKSLSSLVEAYFDVGLDEHDFLNNNSIIEAVRAFDCARFLTLSAAIMRALSRAPISLLTEFTRLVKLEAGTYCSSLQDFIQSSCNLEALIIYQGSSLGTSDPHDHPSWNAPVEVPGCLSNSLKKVRLDGYKGLEDEREMIRYMLKHGSVLEVMHISCSNKGDREKLELHQEICDLPRKSPACKVQFYVWPSK